MTIKTLIQWLSGTAQFNANVVATDTPSGANGTTTTADAGKVPLLDATGHIPQAMEYPSIADATTSGTCM